jgi:hypothetical protein
MVVRLRRDGGVHRDKVLDLVERLLGEVLVVLVQEPQLLSDL